MSASQDQDPLLSEEGTMYHLNLLGTDVPKHPGHEASLAPIIASPALRRLVENHRVPQNAEVHADTVADSEARYLKSDPESAADADTDPGPSTPLQYGLLAGVSDKLRLTNARVKAGEPVAAEEDPRLFFNITPPSSTFICGSQGSGKSHTLSCILEACLIPSSKLGRLPKPLAAVVFHYDTFISDARGQPCEAAYLASNDEIEVRVLCAPTNIPTIKKTYAGLNVTIEPLTIDQGHLGTQRMMELMAVSEDDVPLYMESVKRILREMRIAQQKSGARGFNYREFRTRIDGCDFTPGQMAPLLQRLDALESFMPASQTKLATRKRTKVGGGGTDWTSVPGRLTIVDLSCPCISPATACSLFNICLSIFLQSDMNGVNVGRVVALDEAHKYMTSTPESAVFTETILRAVRLQRHLGARIIVSTQEPTVSTALLDLCSVTIVHRFTSPDWMKVLKGHLAAAQKKIGVGSSKSERDDDTVATLFERIVQLKVGEALLFAPSAIVGVRVRDDQDNGASGFEQGIEFEKLGGKALGVTVRGRLTVDGGKSILSQ
ncbi:uncharacterized protein BDV17DRAFT_19247 [Aspergillus undulatus]|uniref:uncharacterized protein n=1 Tax=Aspergillus undulatus TaxID=1810928 RepID=UPI003CCE3312